MGLTGLAIFKQLPKKNCGECGVPTCMAFAMALAAGKASLDACPYVTDEAKEALDSASAPPIKKVKVGVGEKEVELGDETVLFRHDKTFFHPTGLGFVVDDNDAAFDEKIEKIADLQFDRVGLHYEVEFITLNNASGDAATFAAAAEKAAAKKAVILKACDPAVVSAALDKIAAEKPLVYAATADNYEAMVEAAKKYEVPLAVYAEGLDALEDLVNKITALGYKELVLDPGSRQTAQVIADMTQIRRLAIKKTFRPFGYPTITFTSDEDPMDEAMQATAYIGKYASIVVMKNAIKGLILPIVSWRQNVFTDPQKPVAVEAKLMEVGAVNGDSPLYVTTNFSLSYYSVEGEVEASRIPSYIIPIDTDGTSVLTAWAAGKFGGEHIAAAMKAYDVDSKLNHKNVIIPGFVAVIAAKLKEESGWNVIVGPKEATGISGFAKANFA
ncbi:MAG TPA: acetyl-CoA decarbonylase/synthase complex subunit gamma [Clostridiales bacterium]|nr:acetyl-CoA decarbonylase/synthase complex subunit gamma [Clostridiales bacterium]